MMSSHMYSKCDFNVLLYSHLQNRLQTNLRSDNVTAFQLWMTCASSLGLRVAMCCAACGGCSTVGTLSQFCLEGTAFCECRPGYTGQFCTILLATTAPTVITTTPTAAATTPTAPATTTPRECRCTVMVLFAATV